MVLALAIEVGEKSDATLDLRILFTMICLKFFYSSYCYLFYQLIFVLMLKMCHLLFIASTLCFRGWPLTCQLEAYLHSLRSA
jgi:hypothetical protein